MRHVKPHHWADAAQGRLDDKIRASMNLHADGCERCGSARARISLATGTTGTFAAIRKESSPELGWDSIRARIHWDVSTELRSRPRMERLRQPRRPWLVAGAFGFAAAAVAASIVGVVAWRGHASSPGGDVAVAPAPLPTPSHPEAPASLVGVVSRFAGEVMIDGIRRSDAFDRTIGAGALVATGDGRIDIQFGEASALSLGPRSSLEMRHFDAQSIELAVDGTIDVEVAPRANGQKFVVVAGDHTIEVRGTQFRVKRDGAGTHVACRHGLVAVRDAHGQIEVGAAKRVDVRAGHVVSDEKVVAMSADELAQLAAATPVTTISHDTVPLELVGPSRRAVRVDGVELGTAPMRVRVTPGRHLVEAADDAGRFRRVEWVTVEANKPATVRVELAVEAPPPPNSADRRRQFLAGIDRGRLNRCVRAIVKEGITDLFVQIELGVDTTGAVNFLNVVDPGDLDAATASCVREALADVRFAPGAAASWRERIGL